MLPYGNQTMGGSPSRHWMDGIVGNRHAGSEEGQKEADSGELVNVAVRKSDHN
jgi:hypothetical protein